MRDLDALLDRIDAVLLAEKRAGQLGERGRDALLYVTTTPVDRPVETVRRLLVDDRLLARLADDPVLTGRWEPEERRDSMGHLVHGCNPLPDLEGTLEVDLSRFEEAAQEAQERLTELDKPRPRPPRPFPRPLDDPAVLDAVIADQRRLRAQRDAHAARLARDLAPSTPWWSPRGWFRRG